MLARFHDANLIHGDLTTSNMMIRNSSNQLVSLFSPILIVGAAM